MLDIGIDPDMVRRYYDAESGDHMEGRGWCPSNDCKVKIVKTDGSALFGWTADAAAKAFESNVTNYSGSTLPSTGVMGTYLRYTVGAACILLIGLVLVAIKEES